jgi:hypothetical protein
MPNISNGVYQLLTTVLADSVFILPLLLMLLSSIMAGIRKTKPTLASARDPIIDIDDVPFYIRYPTCPLVSYYQNPDPYYTSVNDRNQTVPVLARPVECHRCKPNPYDFSSPPVVHHGLIVETRKRPRTRDSLTPCPMEPDESERLRHFYRPLTQRDMSSIMRRWRRLPLKRGKVQYDHVDFPLRSRSPESGGSEDVN